MIADPVVAGRIRHIREMCTSAIRRDAGAAGGGLTDRAWLAESVLNILSGTIDEQILRELGPRWSFLDSVNWPAILAHETKFADMPRVGNPLGWAEAAPQFGPAGTPAPGPDEEQCSENER